MLTCCHVPQMVAQRDQQEVGSQAPLEQVLVEAVSAVAPGEVM